MSYCAKCALFLIFLIPSFAVSLASPEYRAALVVFEYDFNSNQEITCDFAEFSKEQYKRYFTSLEEEKRKPIEMRMNQELRECDFLTEVSKYAKPFLDSANRGEINPENLFVFLITKLGSEKEAHKGRQIGFFESIEKCNFYRKLAIEINISTLECRNWNLNRY